jgi:hypothetical protein
MPYHSNAGEIAKRNDLLRTTWIRTPNNRVVLSHGVSHLVKSEPGKFSKLVEAVQGFKDFTPGNDPHGEHDFGSLAIDGVTYFWKIDYYDAQLEFGLDPMDPKCVRVLTVMESSEY